MSVDESMVILAPMFHVGCASASVIGDLLELLARVPAERAAARGEDDAAGPRAAAPERIAW